MVITFAQQKGGTGKTTMTTNTAVELARRGLSVCIIDGDPKSDSYDWAVYRADNNTEYAEIPVFTAQGDLTPTVNGLKADYDFILIDCIGADSQTLRYAITLCDKVYFPMRPNTLDMKTCEWANDMVRMAKPMNENIQGFFLLTQVPTNPMQRRQKEAKELLLEWDSVKLCNVSIKSREAYAAAYDQGLGVMELNDSSAKGEVSYFVEGAISNEQ